MKEVERIGNRSVWDVLCRAPPFRPLPYPTDTISRGPISGFRGSRIRSIAHASQLDRSRLASRLIAFCTGILQSGGSPGTSCQIDAGKKLTGILSPFAIGTDRDDTGTNTSNSLVFPSFSSALRNFIRKRTLMDDQSCLERALHESFISRAGTMMTSGGGSSNWPGGTLFR
jgi:hypothetical protein